MNKENESNNKDYCLISKEVVILLEWLITYDSKLLENLVKKVWKKGFEQVYIDFKNKNSKLEEYVAQQTILDFFYLLDTSLDQIAKDCIYEKQSIIKNMLDKNLSVNFEQSDIHKNSIEKVFSYQNFHSLLQNTTLEKDEQKSTFFKNFLKNWDPHSSTIE